MRWDELQKVEKRKKEVTRHEMRLDEVRWGDMTWDEIRWDEKRWEKMRSEKRCRRTERTEMSRDRFCNARGIPRQLLTSYSYILSAQFRQVLAIRSSPGLAAKYVFAFLYMSITWTWNGSKRFQPAQQCLQKAGIGKKHMKRIETWCSKMFDRVSKPVKETNHSSIKNSFIELCFSILWNVKHFSDPPMSKKVAEMIRDGENLTHHPVKLK